MDIRVGSTIRAGIVSLSLATLVGCGGVAKAPEWPPTAKKWFDRAENAYAHGNLEDAKSSSERALAELPHEPAVRLIAAKVALAELDYGRVIELLKTEQGRDAQALRGRAYWYLGDVEKAADELEKLTADPEVIDNWAKEIGQLARSGRGRRPYEVSGGMVGVTEMPRTGTTSFVVPLELNGEPCLALVSTESTETAIDSKDTAGAWVSLRIGGDLEVSDVPAVARDLSGYKRQIGAPIKLLIGVNLLRHLNATIDFSGSQFVARSYEPPPPPDATTVHPIFFRGGALVVSSAFSTETSAPPVLLFVNTAMQYPIALDEVGWKKGGLDSKSFPVIPGSNGLSEGLLPMMKLGAFEVPNVPGVSGVPLTDLEKSLGIDLDGVVGSALFATFRLTFADHGKTLWVEDLPQEVVEARIAAAQAMRARAQQAPAAPTAPASPPPGPAPVPSAGAGKNEKPKGTPKKP